MKKTKYIAIGNTSCKRDKKLLSISIYLNICGDNKERFLKALDSLISSSWDCHEIALVDNGSNDATFEVLKEFVVSKEDELISMGKRIHLIKLSKNLGFARANNIAYYSLYQKYGPFDYVALVNNDVILTKSSFKKTIKVLESDKRIAGVQGFLLNPSESVFDSGPLYWSIGFFSTPRPLQSFIRVPSVALYPQIVGYLDGAFSVYRGEVIDEVGFFNVDTFMYGDDYVLGAKIYEKGYVLIYVPVYIGKHYRGLTRKLAHYKILKCLNKNELVFSKKSLVVPPALVNLGALVSLIDLTSRIIFMRTLLFLLRSNYSFREKIRSKIIEYEAALEGILSALIWKPKDPFPKYRGPAIVNDLLLTIPFAYDLSLKINKDLTACDAIEYYIRRKFLTIMKTIFNKA
ncbi:hypothetical protein EYM_02355 [Ignicoccus islandicus DSM 13165]|uniref:Glycosyltransferase 2-like domain-containing protein n=1 Tax=Ignicoccus islandicus DSM 13165 TaxID=940295 RepID=A0A0U3E330_9CREN|nr:glycosyltransferase family 2 protein [Ignicoccus islandicus]ALU12315.1 hypothetical protein EYM_02355 [Ignicoccus islandicus DSM 13165]